MKSKEFDVMTARKIMNEYADKINIYMKENQNLKNQIEDFKITLDINKELLSKIISENPQNSDQFNLFIEYKNDNLRLLEKNEKLHNYKTTLENRIYKMKEDFSENNLKFREELDKAKEEIFVLQNKLREKESCISVLKKNIRKLYDEKIITKEVFVIEPTKINVEMNNELESTRELISKVSKLINVEKIKNERLELKIRQSMIGNLDNEKKSGLDRIEDVIIKNDVCIQDKGIKEVEWNASLSNEISDIESNSMETYEIVSSISSLENYNEVPAFKFDEKVHYDSNTKPDNQRKTSISSVVPKLNFNKIESQYDSKSAKALMHNCDNQNKEIMNAQHFDDDIRKEIEKYKIDYQVAQKTIKELKSKLEKIKESYKKNKTKLIKTNERLKASIAKVGSLEKEIKKILQTGTTSTDDLSNKRYGSISIVNI